MAITSPVHGCRVSKVGVRVCGGRKGVGRGGAGGGGGGGGAGRESWVLRIHPDHRVNPLTE